MDNAFLNEETLREEIAKARKSATVANVTEPHANFAYYDRDSGKIVINIKKHGATFSFPTKIAYWCGPCLISFG